MHLQSYSYITQNRVDYSFKRVQYSTLAFFLSGFMDILNSQACQLSICVPVEVLGLSNAYYGQQSALFDLREPCRYSDLIQESKERQLAQKLKGSRRMRSFLQNPSTKRETSSRTSMAPRKIKAGYGFIIPQCQSDSSHSSLPYTVTITCVSKNSFILPLKLICILFYTVESLFSSCKFHRGGISRDYA